MTQLDLQQKLERAEAETRFIGGALAICQKDISECREVMSAVIEERDALQQQVNALAAENANMRNAIDQTIGWQESVDPGNEESVRMLVDLKTLATDAIMRQWMAEVVSCVPSVCDGKEQKAFEQYAKEQRLDLEQHPLHYLFLDDKTNTARNAWRECLNYVAAQLRQPEEKGHV
jgi:FtsZ-binding cell division protein ZapB